MNPLQYIFFQTVERISEHNIIILIIIIIIIISWDVQSLN